MNNSKKIKIECPYCGTKQEVEVSGYYGDLVPLCANLECEKDFVVSWEIEPKIKVRKIAG